VRTEVYQRGDGEWVTHVYLSRRNLLTLLAKLDGHPPGSSRTIEGPILYPATTVTADEDEAHYAHESRGKAVGTPGPMHPRTERRIAELETPYDPERDPELADDPAGFVRAMEDAE